MATIHSGVVDDGAKLQILPSTRQITVPVSESILGVEGDHRSAEITFQCPKVIDGHDVTKCASHYISWANAIGRPGRYDIKEITVDDDNMYFKWVIDATVTEAAGDIYFSVHFMDLDDDGLVLYKWGTTSCTGLRVLPTTHHHTDDEDDDGLLYVDINDGSLANAVESAVRGVLYG